MPPRQTEVLLLSVMAVFATGASADGALADRPAVDNGLSVINHSSANSAGAQQSSVFDEQVQLDMYNKAELCLMKKRFIPLDSADFTLIEACQTRCRNAVSSIGVAYMNAQISQTEAKARAALAPQQCDDAYGAVMLAAKAAAEVHESVALEYGLMETQYKEEIDKTHRSCVEKPKQFGVESKVCHCATQKIVQAANDGIQLRMPRTYFSYIAKCKAF